MRFVTPSLLQVAIAISLLSSSGAIKCYGAKAFQKAHSGERDCYFRFAAGVWKPCWSKCGCVNVFMDAADENPSGKELCPYKENRHLGYSAGSSKPMPCNCSMWHTPLPGGNCPKCDDFNAISPLMMTSSRDASSAGIELGTCPPGFDACFNYCVNGDKLRHDFMVECAYGCAKVASKPNLDLVVATKLWTLGNFRGNPVDYACEGWAFECTKNFCQADGCNQMATIPKMDGWKQVYTQRLVLYGIFIMIALNLCVFLMQRERGYVPI